jgi:Pyruvate/2-oxoacid:ferredoxin oxidoreductase delta subunit
MCLTTFPHSTRALSLARRPIRVYTPPQELLFPSSRKGCAGNRTLSIWRSTVVGIIILTVAGVLLALLCTLWLFGERWRPLRRSTWRMTREGGVGLKALHGYVYGRWTNQYIKALIKSMPSARHNPGAGKWLSDHYHGKVLRHEEARAIINLNKEIPLRDLDQIIPYPTARNLVLKGPPDVAAYECGCRHARVHACQPTQVCMVVGQPFVDFILEHNPQSSRRLTQAEALDLLRAEHERGHVHSAWFKDACLDRFYAICNCCKCCCGGIEAMRDHGVRMVVSSGYVANVNPDLCNVCEACVDVCPFEAFSMKDTGVERSWELCMGCGVCVEKCPTEAISLVRDERKGVPLDVRVMA